MDNKEQCRKLANRIYELDEKVYKTSGSGLGKTFTGEKARVLDDLTKHAMTFWLNIMIFWKK